MLIGYQYCWIQFLLLNIILNFLETLLSYSISSPRHSTNTFSPQLYLFLLLLLLPSLRPLLPLMAKDVMDLWSTLQTVSQFLLPGYRSIIMLPGDLSRANRPYHRQSLIAQCTPTHTHAHWPGHGSARQDKSRLQLFSNGGNVFLHVWWRGGQGVCGVQIYAILEQYLNHGRTLVPMTEEGH